MRIILKNILELIYTMSASRSVAAARARRAGGGGNNNARNTLKASEMQNAQFTPQQSATSDKKEPSNSKLSVSDAFALVTIRLGRVESILQKVDIANIVAKLETGEGASVSNNTFVKSLISRIEDLEAGATSGGSGVSDEVVDELRDIIDKNEKEIITLKETIFNMQSMLINVNQKLSSMEMPKRESKEDLSVANVADELSSGPTFSSAPVSGTRDKPDEEEVKIVYSDDNPVENMVVSPNDQVSLSEPQPEPESEPVTEE